MRTINSRVRRTLTDESFLRKLLEDVSRGAVSIDEAVGALSRLPFADIGLAKVDHHRYLRVGVPEAVYGPGKSPEQVEAICLELISGSNGPVLVTRASREQFDVVSRSIPEAQYHEPAGLIVARGSADAPIGVAMVIAAGTADLPVAEEAALVLQAYGAKVERLVDVGVAGLHRILSFVDDIRRADVIVVVAGMDGALAGIVGGLVRAPVIAVPASVGYGAGAGGIAPLLTMLNSCAPGICVVNIDNGYGAAVVATKILRSNTR